MGISSTSSDRSSTRAIKQGLAGRVPLIGFVGGPCTVASYVVEGGSQGFTRLKTMLYAEPRTAHALFEKLTRAAIVQLEAQIAAGAEAAQVFESWLGELAREDLEEFSFPYLARIAQSLRRTGVPVIFFATGTSTHLAPISELGYDVVSVDWRIPLAEARRVALMLALPWVDREGSCFALDGDDVVGLLGKDAVMAANLSHGGEREEE